MTTATAGQVPGAEQPAEVISDQRTYPGWADQVRHVRRDVAEHLSKCPAADDAILIASEFATNAILFSLLCYRVAIAAIGGQLDLRPTLFDYLFLAAACHGTTWDGSASNRAGQLRHGYHRTRRVRKEILHSRSRGGHFTIRVQLHRDFLRLECQDAGGVWRGRHQMMTGPMG
jgi:hypothetical protein